MMTRDQDWRDDTNYHDAAWALFDGSAFRQVDGKLQQTLKDLRLYRNTRLLFTHVPRVGGFYASMVMQGTLPTDGDRLPDGSRGAIPIDPQVGGNEAHAKALRVSFAYLCDRWRWQAHMGLRPLYGSLLRTAFTELIDDPRARTVWPQLIWPGDVAHVELNPAGDVIAYRLEYPVTMLENGRQVTFQYRKDVDKQAFRHYRGDSGTWRPWTPDGSAPEVPNPYGFVPAIYDRHRLGRQRRDGTHQLGAVSAIEATFQPLYELNSFFSNGIDYTGKTFRMPAVIRGWTGQGPQTTGPGQTADPRAYAEQQDFQPVDVNGGVEILQFDMGQAREMVQDLKAFVLEENPEASFYHELRQMSTLTGPAVERALGDVVSLVNLARNSYDPNTVKLFQMAISMCAMRYHDGSWVDRTTRDDVFKPYSLDSYKSGLLDMTILERPVVPRTYEERMDMLAKRELLHYQDSFVELGMSMDDAGTLISAREAADLRRASVV